MTSFGEFVLKGPDESEYEGFHPVLNYDYQSRKSVNLKQRKCNKNGTHSTTEKRYLIQALGSPRNVNRCHHKRSGITGLTSIENRIVPLSTPYRSISISPCVSYRPVNFAIYATDACTRSTSFTTISKYGSAMSSSMVGVSG